MIGFARGRLVADLDAYERHRFADGTCPLTWRQGLKHDAAAVMELTGDGLAGPLRNKLGEPVDVEPEYVYPLLKGADLAGPAPVAPRRGGDRDPARIGQDTRAWSSAAPRLWPTSSATPRASRGGSRRSTAASRRSRCSASGPYSFAPYKVAVSGLHSRRGSTRSGPVAGRPVMLDDTGYFLACRSAEQAALVAGAPATTRSTLEPDPAP